jgi:hypothetical protein
MHREAFVTDEMARAGTDILRRGFDLNGVSDQKLRVMAMMAFKAMAAAQAESVDGR